MMRLRLGMLMLFTVTACTDPDPIISEFVLREEIRATVLDANDDRFNEGAAVAGYLLGGGKGGGNILWGVGAGTAFAEGCRVELAEPSQVRFVLSGSSQLCRSLRRGDTRLVIKNTVRYVRQVSRHVESVNITYAWK